MGSTGREQTLHCDVWLTPVLPLTVTSRRSTDPPYSAATPCKSFPSTAPPLILALDPSSEALMPTCVECRGWVCGVNGDETDTALCCVAYVLVALDGNVHKVNRPAFLSNHSEVIPFYRPTVDTRLGSFAVSLDARLCGV